MTAGLRLRNRAGSTRAAAGAGSLCWALRQTALYVFTAAAEESWVKFGDSYVENDIRDSTLSIEHWSLVILLEKAKPGTYCILLSETHGAHYFKVLRSST